MQDISHAQTPLVAVVVTHNRLAQLKTTLARLRAEPAHVLGAIVVVNNASSDTTQDWLNTAEDPRLHALHLPENLGGAGGFEAGMRYAANAFDPDWIVVMDDDARPAAGALARFGSQDRSQAEAWAAAVLHPDGRLCDMNRPFQNPLWHKALLRKALTKGREGFYLAAQDYANTAALQPIDGASFVGLFVSRTARQRIGYPQGALFIYGDDVLYTLSLRQAGGTLLFDPALRFEHDFESQTAARGRFSPLWKSYYHHRNLVFIYRLTLGWLFWPALPALAAKWALKTRHYKGERLRYLGLTARALWHGLWRKTAVAHQTVQSWAASPR